MELIGVVNMTYNFGLCDFWEILYMTKFVYLKK
jgi:hypothetical protein